MKKFLNRFSFNYGLFLGAGIEYYKEEKVIDLGKLMATETGLVLPPV